MLLPLEVVWHYGLRTVRLAGERFDNINTGLFSGDFPELDSAESRAFAESVAECLAPYADALSLDCMPTVWNGAGSPFAGLATSDNPNPSFQLPLHPTMEETIAQLNAKTRR